MNCQDLWPFKFQNNGPLIHLRWNLAASKNRPLGDAESK